MEPFNAEHRLVHWCLTTLRVMPPKILVRLGLAFLFVAVAIYISSGYWLKSLIFTSLDYRVSLASRQIKSPPFQINLDETYFVSLHLDDSADDWYDDGRCNYKSVNASEWQVYRLSLKPRELWANSADTTGRSYYLGGFNATPGQYELEWNLPASAACLDHRHPRLLVSTGSTGYEDGVALIRIFQIFFGGTGAALVLLASARAVKNHFAAFRAPRMFPEMVLRNAISITKHAPMPLIHGPPHWPLFCVALLSILMFIFMIVEEGLPSKGMFVSWRKANAVAWEKSPWPDTLEVYVNAAGQFFVNGHEVERNDLHAKLIEQLSRRAEWTVYFEADRNAMYMDGVYAIGTIQDCGAQLFWITPKIREEWQHSAKHHAAKGKD